MPLPTYNDFYAALSRFWPAADFKDTRKALRMFLLAAIYFAAARFGLKLAFAASQVSFIWPPTGIALAALLLFGQRVWPGIFVGAFAANILAHEPALTAFSIAIGNTLEGLLGMWLMHRYLGLRHYYLERLSDVLCLAVFTAGISTTVAATIGTLSLCLSGVHLWSSFATLWFTWWLGDAGGALIVAPLILAWGRGPYRRFFPGPMIAEMAGLAALTAAACAFIFIKPEIIADTLQTYPYMAFPLVLWAAIRFGLRGVTLLTILISAAALWATVHDLGTFTHMPREHALAMLQTFIMVVSLTGMTMSAAMSERQMLADTEKQSQSRLNIVLENMVDGLITFDVRGIVHSYNKACHKIFGYTAGEIIGQSVSVLIPGATGARGDQYLRDFFKTDETMTTGIGHETKGLRKDGALFPIELSVAEMKIAGGRCIFSGIIRDITQRKETEDSLRNYADDLKRSNQELDDFAYIVSHDLKEPLRGLQSFSQFLLEDYGDKLDADGKNKLNTILNLSDRLGKLLDTLLYFSRLGRAEVAIRETDLNEVIRNVIGILSINLREKNATVNVRQSLPTIECDSARIGEVFQNLISNALKYTDSPETKIEIGIVTDHPRAPGERVFYVSDNGIGIPEKHLEAVFKMFKRLHVRDAYGGGTGSGLAICKKIITQQGGEIWAESKGEGQGTSFFFTIPQDGKRTIFHTAERKL